MKKAGLNGKSSRRARQKVAIGFNTALALLLAAMLVLMVNYLSYRHYLRADLSRSQYYKLSEKTLGLLGGLTNTIDLIVFFQPGNRVYEDLDNLLREYEYASPNLRIERVDPDRDVARAEELAVKYKMAQANVLVLDNGGRSRFLTANDIVEYDYTPMQYGKNPEKVAFKGEQSISSAIQNITQSRVPAIYFLEGHGERSVDDHSPRAGFSEIAQQIRRDNMEVQKLVLGRTDSIPTNCDVLVIARPTKKFSDPEIDLIRKYLDRKGHVMLLIDPLGETGLEKWLAEWGVRIGMDVVVDATRTLTGGELFLTDYERHPITEKLSKVTSIFYLPRAVEPIPESAESASQPDRPKVSPLAACSLSGWAETDLTQSPMKYDPATDRPGPVPVAVAVEKGASPSIDLTIRPTRMVVFGDSDFVANGHLLGGNEDLFMASLNWLLEREELMAISSKPVERNQLIMTDIELRLLFWVVIFGIPLVIVLFGSVVWLKRRV